MTDLFKPRPPPTVESLQRRSGSGKTVTPQPCPDFVLEHLELAVKHLEDLDEKWLAAELQLNNDPSRKEILKEDSEEFEAGVRAYVGKILLEVARIRGSILAL